MNLISSLGFSILVGFFTYQMLHISEQLSNIINILKNKRKK